MNNVTELPIARQELQTIQNRRREINRELQWNRAVQAPNDPALIQELGALAEREDDLLFGQRRYAHAA